MLGLPKGKVRLHPYTPAWAEHFKDEKRRIEACLGTLIVDVYHFGSTSVPGLDAKPIIDSAITVRSLDAVERCIPLLHELGYDCHGECVLQESIFFTRGEPVTHHAHIVEHDGMILKKWLYFRDRLRTSSELSQRYLDLKRELEKKYSDDRVSYGIGKNSFLKDVLSGLEDSS